MSTQITISRSGEQYGPYSIEDLTSHLETGAIVADDLAWMEGMEEWRPLREVIDIETIPKAQQPPPPPPPPASAIAPQYVPQLFDYRSVPWPRKALTVQIFSYTALVLWFIGGAPLAFLVVLFPAIVVLTGDVYTRKINPDGSPKTWSRKLRLAPVVLCAVVLLVTIATILIRPHGITRYPSEYERELDRARADIEETLRRQGYGR